MVLFIMLYKVGYNSLISLWICETRLACDHSTESYKQYFHMIIILIIMLYKVVL